MKDLRYIALWAVALLLLTACGKTEGPGRAQTAQEKKRMAAEEAKALKIAVVPTLDCLPLYLAKEQGIFKSLNTDIRLHRYKAQMDCDTALMGGSVQGAVTDLIRAEHMQRKGTPLLYVTATNAGWQLISNRIARIKKINQLGDKMIGMTRFSATDFLSDYAIDSVRMKRERVFKIQLNDVELRLRMLQNNEIDAVILPEPQATTARLSGHHVLMDTRDKNMRLGVVAFRTKDMAKGVRAKQLQQFIKAYNRACDSINIKGIEHYAAVIKKYCNTDDKTIRALPPLKFFHIAPPRESDLRIARKF